jgi:hypothetical protein
VKRGNALFLLPLLLFPLIETTAHAAGSTIPVFVIDATNTGTYSLTGSSLNSSVSELANSVSGTATTVSLESGSPTPGFYFNGSGYMSFSNNVKPDITNGVSIQLVAKLNSASYAGGSWPRVFDFGETTGWGANYDNFSVQLGQSGSLEVYVSKHGVASSYTCLSGSGASSPLILDTYALYSLKVGSGVCTMSVNGGSNISTTNSDATVSFATHVPSTSTTWVSRVASMVTGLQSPLNGRIRTLIISSGTTASNSVVYMPNGGSGYTASQTGSSSITINSNQFTNAGYSFTGWNSKADGSGTPYAAGDSFNLSSNSLLLYAQWAVIPPSLSLPALSTATFRTSYSIVLTINTAGKYTFYDAGKRIPGCISLTGNPPSVTCNWKPSKQAGTTITAVGKISGSNYSSNAVRVNAIKRSTQR